VLIRPEFHGEAYYVDPVTCIGVYIKDGDVAYKTMRYLSLGVTDADLSRLPLEGYADVPEESTMGVIDLNILGVMYSSGNSTYMEEDGVQIFTLDLPDMMFSYANKKIVTVDREMNSVDIEYRYEISDNPEIIAGNSYIDVPFSVNQICMAKAYGDVMESYYGIWEEEFFGEEFKFDFDYDVSKYNLVLDRDRPIVITRTITMVDAIGGDKIASCTYPSMSKSIIEDHATDYTTVDPYKEMITFVVYKDYDPVKTGGYIIGDLESGAESDDIFVPWYLDRYWDYEYPNLDVPPWVDTENVVSTFIDNYENSYLDLID